MTKALALWTYQAQEVLHDNKENEISFTAGDHIEIIDLCNTDWYEGVANGFSGFFPANHVKILEEVKVESNTVKVDVPEPIALPLQEPLELEEPIESDHDSEHSGWNIVTTETGQVYYWNEETGETSWTAPGEPIAEGQSPKDPKISLEIVTDHIEIVPPELVRKEGLLTYKIKKEFGGIEPKKQKSWNSSWAVLCVGYLIFYKDEPSKLKKKSDKPILPIHVVKLDMILVKKDSKGTTRKNVISIQSRSGALLLVQMAQDNEVSEWFTAITDCTRENSTVAEYENVISRLFVKHDLSAPLPKLAKKTSAKKQKSVSKNDDDGEEPNKFTVKNRLNTFFKRVGDIKIDKTKEKLLAPEEIIFGGNLESLAKTSGKNVPDFVQKCIQHVQQYGLDSQGIYRLSGNAATVQKFRTQLNHNNDSDLYTNDTDVNVVAALLKLFLREIQVPVIPFAMYNRFIDVMKVEDYNTRLCDIKTLVQQLPKVHYDVLETLMRHLVVVAGHCEINKMEPSNLAIVFGPSLIRQPESNVADMQAAYANMMNMSFQNALIESMVVQTEVYIINVVDV